MAKEPTLTFKLSRPDKFHCSGCPNIGDQGAFTLAGRIEDLIAAFRHHVAEHHSKREDVNQAAFRVMRESTEDR